MGDTQKVLTDVSLPLTYRSSIGNNHQWIVVYFSLCSLEQSKAVADLGIRRSPSQGAIKPTHLEASIRPQQRNSLLVPVVIHKKGGCKK